VTRCIRLGPLVCFIAYRSPVQLARLATDVDRLSGGWLILGLDAGWFEWAFALLGLRFPGVRECQAMLAETIQILHGPWGTTPVRVEPDNTHPGASFGLPGPSLLSFDGARSRQRSPPDASPTTRAAYGRVAGGGPSPPSPRMGRSLGNPTDGGPPRRA
jgi:alkanesulfonate monooxygenase SsuD/methylene tetrahydromethanopterin reductase-like flavin-dependent oxidoreductase (luciferase family)